MLMICSPSGFGRDAYSSGCAALSFGPLCCPFSAQNIQRKRNSGTRTDLKIEFSMADPRAGEAVADCSEADAGGRLEVLSTGKRPAIVELKSGMSKAEGAALSTIDVWMSRRNSFATKIDKLVLGITQASLDYERRVQVEGLSGSGVCCEIPLVSDSEVCVGKADLLDLSKLALPM